MTQCLSYMIEHSVTTGRTVRRDAMGREAETPRSAAATVSFASHERGPAASTVRPVWGLSRPAPRFLLRTLHFFRPCRSMLTLRLPRLAMQLPRLLVRPLHLTMRPYHITLHRCNAKSSCCPAKRLWCGAKRSDYMVKRDRCSAAMSNAGRVACVTERSGPVTNQTKGRLECCSNTPFAGSKQRWLNSRPRGRTSGSFRSQCAHRVHAARSRPA
jgi:hypothetical protein